MSELSPPNGMTLSWERIPDDPNEELIALVLGPVRSRLGDNVPPIPAEELL